MELTDRVWKSFELRSILQNVNSKPYADCRIGLIARTGGSERRTGGSQRPEYSITLKC